MARILIVVAALLAAGQDKKDERKGEDARFARLKKLVGEWNGEEIGRASCRERV